jgi:hypothetical protein
MTESSGQDNMPPQVPPPPPPGYYQQSGYPPPGYYQQPPQKQKKPVWPWVLGGILLVIFLGIGGCVAFVGLVATGIDSESKREVTVKYEVTGTGDTVAITYSGRDFNIAQDTGVSLPWSTDVTIDGLGKTVTLTGTRGAGDGTVTCRISTNGRVISEQTSTGPFASAICNGSASDH